MRAMILAAGRGERMRPLTDTCPKPLLPINGQPIIIYLIKNLAKAGITELIINTAHLPEQFQQTLSNGAQWGVNITYSPESPGGYETGGGIVHALPLLGNEPFLVISGDIYTDYPFAQLKNLKPKFAHLILVPNPEFNRKGDFTIANQTYTYGNIGVFNPNIFKQNPWPKSFPLRDWFKLGKFSSEIYEGRWHNFGTPEDLARF